MFWGLAMGFSALVYIVVSLLGKKKEFNMDKLLHRGKYEIKDEIKIMNEKQSKGWQAIGIGKEFSKLDKIIYIGTYAWTFIWVIVFVVGTVINLNTEVSDEAWLSFWKVYIYANLAASILAIVWFAIGGTRDIKDMFQKLNVMERVADDDGTVTNEK